MKNLFRFLPSILWMLIIFYFSSRSTTGVPGNTTQRFVILKSFHLIEYAALAVFLFIGFLKYRHTIICAYLYALSDEFHQSFIPGREGRLRDTFIDLLGIFIGVAVIKLFFRFSISLRLNYRKYKT
jgi:VanZ family protein